MKYILTLSLMVLLMACSTTNYTYKNIYEHTIINHVNTKINVNIDSFTVTQYNSTIVVPVLQIYGDKKNLLVITSTGFFHHSEHLYIWYHNEKYYYFIEY